MTIGMRSKYVGNGLSSLVGGSEFIIFNWPIYSFIGWEVINPHNIYITPVLSAHVQGQEIVHPSRPQPAPLQSLHG